jgi:hypothetical protein
MDSTAITASVTTQACPPNAPTSLNGSATSQTQINLSWTDNSSDETGFKIEQPAGTVIHTTVADVTNYIHTGLTCGTTYDYEIKATNVNGDSTATTSATTQACPLPPVVTEPAPLPTPTYEFSVNKIGNGSLAINNIPCSSGECNRYFGKETVTITATPDSGWLFAGFSGDCSSATVLLDADKSCTAIFEPQPAEYSLTINVKGEGSVDNCGTSCTQTHSEGKIVKLTTTSEGIWALDKWSGDCAKDGSVTMDSDKTCTANFVEGYSLIIDVVTGKGKVKTATQKCQANCEEIVDANATTTLIAEPEMEWVFEKWSGDCDAQGKVEMSGEKTCTANFIPDPNIPNNGDGNGDDIQDVDQPHVVSMPDSVSGEYITIVVDEGVNVSDIYTDLAENQALFDDSIDFPQGVVYLEIEGSETDVTIYYHSLEYIYNPSFQKFGPTTPGDTSTIGWYTMPNVTFGAATIGGNTVVTAKYHLKDGELGDNTGVDGRIVDPGGITTVKNFDNVVGFLTKTENVSTKIGETTLIVTRSGLEGSISVDYATTNGSAVANQDYQTTNGTLTWANGEREDKIITIPILSGASTGKALTVTLTNLVVSDPQTAVLGLDTMTVNIYSNIIGFAADNEDISIQAGITELVVSRSGVHNDVSVDYTTVNDTAIANTDYQPLTGTLLWKDGDDADQTISLSLLDEAMIDKSLNVVLSNLTVTNPQTKLAVADGTLDINTVAVIIISEDENVIGFTSRGYSAFKKKTL